MCRDLPAPYPVLLEDAERAIDAACATRDWPGLVVAVKACERDFCALVTRRAAMI